MDYLLEFFQFHPILSALQTAFMVWMLVDCYRRRAEYFWYFVIFFLPVIGAWVYFFAVKVPAGDFRNLSFGGVLRRGPSLDQLRYLADQTPTLTNHLNLAQRLIEVGQPAEAAPHLEAVLKTEPDHGAALYALASCYKALGRPAEAVPVLEKLLRRDNRWGNYVAWRLLIEMQDKTGDRAGAAELPRGGAPGADAAKPLSPGGPFARTGPDDRGPDAPGAVAARPRLRPRPRSPSRRPLGRRGAAASERDRVGRLRGFIFPGSPRRAAERFSEALRPIPAPAARRGKPPAQTTSPEHFFT